MKNRTLKTLVIAAMLGATVWLLSPWITGQKEPWDGHGSYYFGALVLTGLIAGAVAPKPMWALYVGNFMGQLAYALLFLPVGPLLLVGVGFVLVCCLVFVAAAFACARLKALLWGPATGP